MGPSNLMFAPHKTIKALFDLKKRLDRNPALEPGSVFNERLWGEHGDVERASRC